MNIENVVTSLNRSDIPEQGYVYLYECERPIRFENEDILKEYALQTLNNDTLFTQDECAFLKQLIETNHNYGSQAHAIMGRIYDKVSKRVQFWYGTEYIYINKFWTMRYDSKGNVTVSNHINNQDYKFQPVIVDNYISHKKTKEMIINGIKELKESFEPIK